MHDLFQGKEVHETRCLQCETVTTSENVFYHLSLAITQNSSLTACLRNFRWGSGFFSYLLVHRPVGGFGEGSSGATALSKQGPELLHAMAAF